jgi:hypothetical protein
MKIQIVKKAAPATASSTCPWVIDVPPEKAKK